MGHESKLDASPRGFKWDSDRANRLDRLLTQLRGNFQLHTYLEDQARKRGIETGKDLSGLIRALKRWTKEGSRTTPAPSIENLLLLSRITGLSLDELTGNEGAMDARFPFSCWYVAAISNAYVDQKVKEIPEDSTGPIREEFGMDVAHRTTIEFSSGTWRQLHGFNKATPKPITLLQAIDDVTRWIEMGEAGAEAAQVARARWFSACFLAALTIREGAWGIFPEVPIVIPKDISSDPQIRAGRYVLRTAFDQIDQPAKFQKTDQLYYLIQYLLRPGSDRT